MNIDENIEIQYGDDILHLRTSRLPLGGSFVEKKNSKTTCDDYIYYLFYDLL